MVSEGGGVGGKYRGESGAAEAAGGQVFGDMSSAGPDVSQEIAPVIERAGAQFVEAPVLGSVPAVEGGTLVIFAAGDKEAIQRARPVLEALGQFRGMDTLGSAAKLHLVATSMPPPAPA